MTIDQSVFPWIWQDLTADDLDGFIDADDSVYWGPSLGPYYNSSEVADRLMMYENYFPDIVERFTFGKSYMKQSLYAIKIAQPFTKTLESRYDVVLVSNHHAREAITVMDSLLFVERLIHDFIEAEEWATSLLSKANIYVIPVLNPDGLDYTSIFPWQRMNMQEFDGDGDGSYDDYLEIRDVDGDNYVYASGSLYEGSDGGDNDTVAGEDIPGGIDLNRNYGYEFDGPGSSPNPNAMTHRGEVPFQAPETYAFKMLAESNKFTMSMSLHSGVEAIIAPWGYTSQDAPDVKLFDRIIEELQNRSYMPSWDDIGGYGVNGEWGDWMYGAQGSIAMTIETYGGFGLINLGGSRYGGIWSYFNPDANKIYNTSMEGVQQHLDYYFTIPQESYFTNPVDMSNIAADRSEGRFAVEIQISQADENASLQLQAYNSSSHGWDIIGEMSDLYQSDTHYRVFDIDPSTPDRELRVFIGEESVGRSYYFDFSNGQVGSSQSGPLLGGETSQNTDKSSDGENSSNLSSNEGSSSNSETPYSVIYLFSMVTSVMIRRKK